VEGKIEGRREEVEELGSIRCAATGICRRERVERVWSVERYDAAAAEV
jgi:hypothetical protein